jgi:enoyl-CoA hydratase/carnithine racemase
MLRATTENGIGSIVIDRPEKRNAFSEAMWADLVDMMEALDVDRAVRVIVVRGAGAGAFSAGADLDDLRAAAADVSRAQAGLDGIRRAFAAVAGTATPTIAAVRGACHGGGVGLVVCCDIRVIDTTARFSIPPARLGLVYPYPALRRLVALVGEGQAKRLLYSSAEFDASLAMQMGFAEVLCDPEQFEETLAQLADEIASRSATSLRLTKEVIDAIGAGAPELDDFARHRELEALAGPDHAEGLDAMMSRRPPRFP